MYKTELDWVSAYKKLEVELENKNTQIAELEKENEELKAKNKLVSDITKFEHDYDMEDTDWNICPKPDVRYQWNLEALGLIAPLLSKVFNSEYEWGENR